MTFTIELEYEEAVELCSVLAFIGTGVAVDAASQMQDDIQNENERRYEARQEQLMDDGGTDDSPYRQMLKDAGRGHLLR